MHSRVTAAGDGETRDHDDREKSQEPLDHDRCRHLDRRESHLVKQHDAHDVAADARGEKLAGEISRVGVRDRLHEGEAHAAAAHERPPFSRLQESIGVVEQEREQEEIETHVTQLCAHRGHVHARNQKGEKRKADPDLEEVADASFLGRTRAGH